MTPFYLHKTETAQHSRRFFPVNRKDRDLTWSGAALWDYLTTCKPITALRSRIRKLGLKIRLDELH